MTRTLVSGALLLSASVSATASAQLASFNDLARTLPNIEGNVSCDVVDRPVAIERDGLGIPVVRAESFLDAVRGQGYAHGQDRYFQMDVMRRLAAGRLSELVGGMTVDMDRSFRIYRFESVARAVVDDLAPEHRAILDAYTDGVNAGLDDLPAPPPEYGFISAAPTPWRREDAVLCLLAMFEMLNFDRYVERATGIAVETLPAELVEFLAPARTRFDAILLPEAGEGPAPRATIPGPDVVNVALRDWDPEADLVGAPRLVLGSNNWAVAGARSASGAAMVANDPHLRLSAPGIWYRCELAWRDGDGERFAGGVSLPGSPGIVIGSNGRVAWGVTNTTGDFQDLVLVEVDPEDPSRYLAPDGPEPFGTVTETIDVRGAEPVAMTLRTTRWGVVTDEDPWGRPLVLKWTALDPSMLNLTLFDMMFTTNVDEALDVAASWYGPSQNVVVADDTGRIGWTISGWFPKRVGFDGTRPVSWADGTVGWDGPMDEARRPRLVDPASGILFTANNRTVEASWARDLGRAWAIGVRAQRIRDVLAASDAVTEEDMLALQLDTRVEIFDFYRDIVLELTADDPSPLGAEARAIVEAWNGRADADQPALRILDAFRDAVHEAVIGPVVQPCRDVDPGFRARLSIVEEPVRRLIEERPAHFLPAGVPDWSAHLGGALERTLERLATAEGGLARPWGADRRCEVSHPLAASVPMFARMLNMAPFPIDGHSLAVKVLGRSYGASMRMVVAPGREAHALLHTPAGQSGNPVSPHYRDGQPAWVEGRPSPFRAGPPTKTLHLQPTPN